MSQIPKPSVGGAGSRLAQMQAQFQQKQMQEKEQKLLQMLDTQQQKAMQKAAFNGVIPSNKYTSNINMNNNNNNINNSVGNLGAGKVRQMFEERRRTGGPLSSNSNGYGTGRSTATGIDKSHPLEPLVVNSNVKSRSSSSKSDPSTYNPPSRNTQAPPILKPSNLGSHNRVTPPKSRDSPTHSSAGSSASSNSKPYVQRQVNKSTASHPPPPPISRDEEPDEFVPQTTKYSDYAQELEKREINLSKKLANVSISSPPPDLPKTPAKAARTPTKSPSTRTGMSPRPSVGSTKPTTTTTKVGGKKKPPPRSTSGPPPGLNECKICGRYFAPERIEKHEQICKKASTKKRKIFDPTKMRMQGTEAEPYIRVVSAKTSKPAAVSSTQSSDKSKKSDWRKKHEEFIATIRAAKEYQAHVAKGGDPKDLPPPPPSDNSDYVQCPYCNRKFSQGAAERHIPKCKNIKSNKR